MSFFFSSRRRHTRFKCDWSSDVCSSDLSACPPAMITAFQDEFGVEVLHAWGMTEMSPLGTLCTLKNKQLQLPKDEQMKILQKQDRKSTRLNSSHTSISYAAFSFNKNKTTHRPPP